MQPVAGSHSNPWDAFSTQFRARHDQLASQRQSGEALHASNSAKDALKANEADPRRVVQETSKTTDAEETQSKDKRPGIFSETARNALEINDAERREAANDVAADDEAEETKAEEARVKEAKAEEAEAEEAEAEEAKKDKGGPNDLTEEEEQMVRDLAARDREVRAHEQAHASVGGQYAGAPTYSYQSGPDGKQYAIGGEVSIDISPIKGDPKATINKMQVVIAAALAPAEPSGQDRKVASLAQSMQAQAYGELMSQRAEERSGEAYDKTA